MDLSEDQIKELYTQEFDKNSPYSFIDKSRTFMYILGMSLFGKLLCPKEYDEFCRQFKSFEDWLEQKKK